jgi:hypothetical protein
MLDETHAHQDEHEAAWNLGWGIFMHPHTLPTPFRVSRKADSSGS